MRDYVYNIQFPCQQEMDLNLMISGQTQKLPYPATLSIVQACRWILTLLRYGYD